MVNILSNSDYFLTKLVSPSITPTRGSQPGFSTLIYDEVTQKLSDLQMTFL